MSGAWTQNKIKFVLILENERVFIGLDDLGVKKSDLVWGLGGGPGRYGGLP